MYSIKNLAELLEGKVEGDSLAKVKKLAAFDEATEDSLTFAGDVKFIKRLNETKAGVVIVPDVEDLPKGKTYIIVNKNPRELMPLILSFFKKETKKIQKPIEDSARIHESVDLAPNIYIGHNVEIGKGTTIYPNVTILEGSRIGENCIIYPGVTIREFCDLGNNVILQPGAVIGGDGFGFVKINGENTKVEQIGAVILEDDVEIGANSTIDRGTIGDTIVRRGTKIDNSVQIAHNVHVGEQSLIVAHVAIAGSTKIGKNFTAGGQVGIVGHITIGDNVTAAGKAVITSNTEANQKLSGYPAINYNDDLKAKIAFKKLPELIKRVKKLEKYMSRGEN